MLSCRILYHDSERAPAAAAKAPSRRRRVACARARARSPSSDGRIFCSGKAAYATAKRAEPRQLVRIKRKKTPSGLTKLELRYVSYAAAEAAAARTDADVASTTLAALFTHFLELRGDNRDLVNADTDPVTQNLLLRTLRRRRRALLVVVTAPAVRPPCRHGERAPQDASRRG